MAKPVLLDMGQAADVLGLRGVNKRKVVRAMLLKKEATLGRPLLVRTGGEGVGCRYKIGLSVLHEACPEAFARGDRLAELLAERLDRIEADILELQQHDEAIAKRVREVSFLIRERARAGESGRVAA